MPFNLPAARKAIVIECRKLGLDDETRHDIVRNVGKVASGSTKDMGAEAARRVLDHLRRLSGAPNEWAFVDQAADEKRPLLRKVCATCRGMGVSKAYAEGVARHQHGVERHLEMMDMSELYALAGALARTQAHRK